MFRPVESSVSFPRLEEQTIAFWKERRIYEKSLDARRDAPSFVFFEGPPTANGLPHPGHCLTRAIKDLFPRYRTMRGYRCLRKAGWDTHGLPVEVEVCKELGIHSKEEIESYGIEPFVRKCLESVFRYTRQWEQLTERLGFWIHLDEAYVTYHQRYVESVWWSLKTLFERGLLYQGHKIVWWWAQGGTALSSGEVGEGYRKVLDPSVYVRLPLVDCPEWPDTDLLVWTTTPWTLPSNQFAAVDPELEYSIVSVAGEHNVIVASALVETIAAKTPKKLTVESTLLGKKLIDRRYEPPFDYYQNSDEWGTLRAGGRKKKFWRVVGADFVTTDTGTGIVHQAPAFGEADHKLLLDQEKDFVTSPNDRLWLFCPVAPDGRFDADVPDFQGRWVKEADQGIIRKLKDNGRLFIKEQYWHEYPFCPRAEDDALIQYPREGWFIRTSRVKDMMLANNRQINWLPSHIRDGRFGNFLETNVDWALSRERYWGTPLPIWVCKETGYMEAVASYDELCKKQEVHGTEVWAAAKLANPELPDDLKVHKPYIDAVTYRSPTGHRMRRVSEVIDCWYDAGSMPFAQWGYPHTPKSSVRFADQFPADFISEALDQTRGWFYALVAISTLLFSKDRATSGELSQFPRDENGTVPSGATGATSSATSPASAAGATPAPPVGDNVPVDDEDKFGPETPAVPYPHPFRNCIVLGLMLGEDGTKMSKRKRNYREPQEIFDRYGADALRWFFFANQPPWTSIRYNERAIRECIPEFLLRLWNVYSFLVIYANIDGFDPAQGFSGDPGQLGTATLAASGAKGYRPVADRGELDCWILSELGRATAGVTQCMDAYDSYGACARLTEFVDALSNWYVRRSRDRFWSGEKSAEKFDAYWTLYECMLTSAKLVAPFVPFLAETLWQNLAVEPFGGRSAESVHLCDYPTADPSEIDELLSQRMAVVREIVSLGRSARMEAKIKVRQPLARVEVVLADSEHRCWLENHAALVAEELNVKQVDFIEKADQYITYSVLPDLKRLGPRLGKRLPALRQTLAAAEPGRLLAELSTHGKVEFALDDGPVFLDADDLKVRLQAKPGWAAAQGAACVVVLSTELTEELKQEGIARELVHAIQNHRKEKGCQYTDRIRVYIITDDAQYLAAIKTFHDYICKETLAVELTSSTTEDVDPGRADDLGHVSLGAGPLVAYYVKREAL